MNCTHITKLLPLYVEGDLDTRRAGAVLAHLQSCRPCRQCAAEFEESQRGLRAGSAPEFDDEFFADLQHAVRQEIARPGAPSRLRRRFASRWRWQPVAAFAILLLMIIGGLAIYSRLARPAGRPELTRGDGGNVTRHPEPAEPQITNNHEGEKLGSIKRKTRPAVSLNLKLRGRSGEREPAGATAQAPAAEPEMLRIEIQTADPTIRIIWLIPQNKAQSESE
jgi:anti-sigma factor RsiW